jgi:hypothetical protein
MLVAMFADVFVEHTIGYIAIGAALILFHGFVWAVERLAVGQPEPKGLRPSSRNADSRASFSS